MKIDSEFVCVGDIHACTGRWNRILRANQDVQGPIIQVGDFGAGFIPLSKMAPKAQYWFIRGNHDDPAKCSSSKHYLGDFGTMMIDQRKMFFVGGAQSMDRSHRIQGYNWWPNEELSYRVANLAIDMYAREKPEIVISHDCPQDIAEVMFNADGRSFTRSMLQEMLNIHQPLLWVFGHWHRSLDETYAGTRFVCLDIFHYQKFVLEEL